MQDRSERYRGFRGWRRLALVTAIATYLLIVLGGVVRITESGMGCGPDWPLCDGHLIPPMDFETMLEYGHRLVAAGVGLLIVALTVWAWKPGRTAALRSSSRSGAARGASVSGAPLAGSAPALAGSASALAGSASEAARGGSASRAREADSAERAELARARAWRSLRIITAVSMVLVVIQSLLGAITVWLHLPRGTVILHLSAAMALLALLAVACCRSYAPGRVQDPDAGRPGRDSPARRRLDRPARWTWAGVGFGAVVVLFGALVANLGAAPACQGFPLCNSAWLPADNPLVQIHWAHRMLAYAFVVWAVALPPLTRRWRPADQPAATAARWVGGLTLLQVLVAAAMVLHGLPETLQALHLAVGGAIFAVLVVHGWLVAHPAVVRVRAEEQAPARGAAVRVAAVPT